MIVAIYIEVYYISTPIIPCMYSETSEQRTRWKILIHMLCPL